MKEFRPYQNDGLGATLRVVESGGKRALIVMATGLGKSVVAARFARTCYELFGWRTLWIMHMLEPLENMRDKHCADEFAEIDPTFGMYTGEEKSNAHDSAVLFATFDTMLANLSEFASDEFQLIIVDECHHAWAHTYKTVLDYFEPRFMFGMTATPRRGDGKRIEEIFGEAVYEYPLADALADGRWLAEVDYRVMTDDIDHDVLKELLDQLERDKGIRVSKSDIDKRVFLKERLEEQARRVHDVQENGDKKTIVFCRNRDHLRAVAKHFPKFKPYHSGMKRETLKKRFKAFENGDIRGLLVIDKFNEAVDVPDAELIVFLRATDSMTIWLQQLGRGLRKAEGKGKVIVLDFVANCDRILWVSKFSNTLIGLGGDGGTRQAVTAQTIQTGWNLDIDVDARDILDLLKWRRNGDYYATLEEAQEAARALGCKVQEEYRDRYVQDIKLPASPYNVYSEDWTSWGHFLRGEDPKDCYSTLVEASLAAQNLGIRNGTEYRELKRYKEDPRLPSLPSTFYPDWVSWPHFLGYSGGKRRRSGSQKGTGQEYYPTLAEASIASQLMDVRTKAAYEDACLRDSRLPPKPHYYYSGEWKCWEHFLGTRGKGAMPFELARKLIKEKGVTKESGLRRLTSEHDLPILPRKYYRYNWVSFPHFFGQISAVKKPSKGKKPKAKNKRFVKYRTLKLAMAAVQRLKPVPKSGSEYKHLRKQNDLLHHNPDRYYAKKGWISWPHFLGKE